MVTGPQHVHLGNYWGIEGLFDHCGAFKSALFPAIPGVCWALAWEKQESPVLVTAVIALQTEPSSAD